jgi:hypothetical protein
MPTEYRSLFDTPSVLDEDENQELPSAQPTTVGDEAHSSLFEALGTDPALEARKQELSKQLDTPVALLPSDAEQMAQFNEIDTDKLQQDAPATTKFLADPTNAKLTGVKGVNSLANMEEAYKTYTPENITKYIQKHRELPGTGNSPAELSQKLTAMKAEGVNLADELDPYQRETKDVPLDVLKSAASGVNVAIKGLSDTSRQASIIQRLVGAVYRPYGRLMDEDFKATQEALGEGQAYWQESKSPAIQKLNEEFEKAGIVDSVGMLVKHPQLMADMLAQSAVYLVPGPGVARLGPEGVAGYNMLIEMGDSANSAREEAIAAGRPEGEQDQVASVAALVTGPLVFLGNKLTGASKLEQRFFSTGTIGESLVNAVVKEGISGAVEEGSNQLGVNVAASNYDDERKYLEGVGKAAVIGGVLESTHAVGMSTTERALRVFVKDVDKVIQDRNTGEHEAAKAIVAASTLKDLGTMVDESGLRTNSSEAFNQFVETMVEEGTLTEVYVDSTTMAGVIESNPALRTSAPELVSRAVQAVELGNDLQITVAEYLTHFSGTPLEETLLNMVKVEPNGPTYTEAQEYYNKQAELFQEEIQAVSEANAEVLSRAEFNAQKASEAEEVAQTTSEQQPLPETEQTTQEAPTQEADATTAPAVEQKAKLPATYEEYLQNHSNQREVYARDIDSVSTKLYEQFKQANRFTSPVNRAYVAPLLDFYVTMAQRAKIMPSELFARYPLNIQSLVDLTGGKVLSQHRNASLTDFKAENVENIVNLDNWVVMTAENPANEYTPEQNPERMAQFIAQLEAEGIQYYKVDGKYSRDEKSVILFNTTAERALALGRQWNQESVLTKDGFVYQDGSRHVSTGEVDVHKTAPKDFYTTITFPDGSTSMFTVGINFDQRVPMGDMSPVNPETVGVLTEVRSEVGNLKGLPESSVGRDVDVQNAAVKYMQEAGLPYSPATEYVSVLPERGARIADAYENMEDNPNDPEVRAAYEALVKETLAQYQALKEIGYTFDLIPEGAPDPYAGGPREALLDMKNNKHLWVFPTTSGYGQGETQVAGSPMLTLTDEYLNGKQLLANDIFRIVHDVFGHAKDGVGFGPRGEENAWQSHVRMFSPLAARAMTTETRGQNSWVNYGPLGEQNRANQKETVYAEQKVGLLPEWVSTEGLTLGPNILNQSGKVGEVSITGVHYSPELRDTLDGTFYGKGAKGAERDRVLNASDDRIKNRVHFYVDEGNGVFPEFGVGSVAHTVNLTNMYDAARNPLKFPTKDTNDPYNADGFNVFESAVLDAGFDGYYVEKGFGRQGVAVLLGESSKNVKVPQTADVYQSTYYSALTRAVSGVKQGKGSAAQWKGIIKNMPGVKAEEIEAVGINEWLDMQSGSVTKEAIINYLDANGVQVEEVVLGQVDRSLTPAEIKRLEYLTELNAKQPLGAIEDIESGAWNELLTLENIRDKSTFEGLMAEQKRYEQLARRERDKTKADALWERAHHYTARAEELELSEEGEGGLADTSKYRSYTVGGDGAGTNYREILLTLPATEITEDEFVALHRKKFPNSDVLEADIRRHYEQGIKIPDEKGVMQGKGVRPTTYRSSHFDQQNILAHVRVDERVGPNGERVLFVNEIQSDWAQEGKKKGFDDEVKPLTEAERKELREVLDYNGLDVNTLTPEQIQRREELILRSNRQHPTQAVPRAPFVQKTDAWVSLAIKRILRYAADQGMDKVAIINGQQAADLYDLSKQIDDIRWKKDGDKYNIVARRDGSPVMQQYGLSIDEVADNVGKDIASKIEKDSQEGAGGIIEGIDLRVGGEGMRVFYDQIVPKVARDVLKKLGATTAEVNIADVDPNADKYQIVLPNGKVVHTTNSLKNAEANLEFFEGAVVKEYTPDIMNQVGVELTPELKAKVQSGLPLFQGTRGSFNLDTLTMTLLQGADFSTVIHESGHFYLKMLETLASNVDAPQDIKDDFQKVLDWFELTESDWRAMSLDQQRPYHEQWAESFELWNLEGKAPSQKLQPVFSRFRAWLLDVYRSIEDFLKRNPSAGKLNDEVRGVFSRMLASQEAISAAEQARAYQPLFPDAAAAGMSEADFQRYLSLGQEATDDANRELQTRSMRDMRWLTNARNRAISELQATARETRKTTMNEVAAEVAREPVYQAMRFLRSGETIDPNSGEVIKALQGYKLDKAILAEMYPDTALGNPDLTKLRGLTGTDGLHPDLIAQMFGLPSGDALVRELASAEKMSDKIAGLTDQRMLEEHGDLTDNQAIQRAADEAVHNEARARFMATGLKALSKTPISVTQMVKAAKQAAESVIANKRVRDIHPKQFLAAETRANKKVMSTVAKSPLEAADAQRVALLNNRLASSAQDALTEVEKALRYLSKFNNEGTRKNLDIDYIEQIDALLEPFDLRKGASLRTIDARTSLAEWLNIQETELMFEPTIDPVAVAEAKQKSYKNMTMTEVRTLVDTVKQIEHLGRMKKKLLTAIERENYLERINEAITSIEENANRVVEEKGTPSDAIGYVGQWLRQMAAAHRKFSSYMRELDGGKNNGAMFNLLVRPMLNAGNTETDMKAKAAEEITRLFKPIQDKISTLGNLYNRRRVVPNTSISMTNEERIMFAMNWGNEGNRQRLLDGGLTGKKALSNAEARAIIDTLTKEEWDFVQGTLDFIATYKPLIAEQERQLTGKTPEWVEASPIETKFGTYPGGYFPAKYDTVLSTRSDSLEAASDLRGAMKGAFGAAATRNGYTKARADAVKGRPLLLNFNVISRHTAEVVHRLAWQAWVIDANRVLRSLDSPLRTHLGAEATKEIRDTVVAIATGDSPSSTPLEVIANRVRNGTSIVGMGWSFATAFIQPIGITNSIARVGVRHMAKGIASFIANPVAASNWANENSVGMRNRGRTLNREVNDILNVVRGGKGVGTITASYFYLIGKMQRMVDVPTYIGAYERSLEEQQYELASSPEERARIEQTAHDVAGQTVIDTQSGGEMKDLAKVQRGGPLFKLFTNFYSYMSMVYNMNVEAFRTTNFKSPSEFGVFVADMILLNFVPVVLSVVLRNALRTDCEWGDTECLVKAYKSEQITHLFGQMVPLREIGAGVSAAVGGDSYGYTGPAGLRFFGDLYKVGVQLDQGEADMALFKALNNAGGTLFHYPAAQVNRTVEGVIAIENGEAEGLAILPMLMGGPPK